MRALAHLPGHPHRRHQLAIEELQRPVQEEADAAPSAPAPAPEPEAPQARKFLIYVQSSGGERQKFRVKSDTKLGTVFDAFCQSNSVERGSVAFSFDGDTVHPNATPAQLDMDEDDVIDVTHK